ncbi:MAG: periplasmic heavy metal sensor [Calditrichae bacterium]|nr:periplasmic heavy metal sensor [Calditrichia bacterium]
MRKRIVLLSVAILLISVGMLTARQKRDGDGPQRMMRMLELTESQESQILDLKLDHEKQILPLRTELKGLRTKMKMELIAEKFNENKVSKLIDQMSNLQKEIHMKRVIHQRAVRDILTEEQRKKFDLHILSRGDKWGGHFKHARRGQRLMRD